MNKSAKIVDFVLALLSEHPDGLTARDILNEVQKTFGITAVAFRLLANRYLKDKVTKTIMRQGNKFDGWLWKVKTATTNNNNDNLSIYRNRWLEYARVILLDNYTNGDIQPRCRMCRSLKQDSKLIWCELAKLGGQAFDIVKMKEELSRNSSGGSLSSELFEFGRMLKKYERCRAYEEK